VRRRARIVGRGTPAAFVLAGGLSRHGSGCYCRYCAKPEPTALTQLLPVDWRSMTFEPMPLTATLVDPTPSAAMRTEGRTATIPMRFGEDDDKALAQMKAEIEAAEGDERCADPTCCEVLS
jgi:hypothetical protein